MTVDGSFAPDVKLEGSTCRAVAAPQLGRASRQISIDDPVGIPAYRNRRESGTCQLPRA
jgi:hypothetical protein